MPFVSQAQAKWAFATKQPWARKWGHKTRLAGGTAKLPQYVTRKTRKWGKRRGLEAKEVPSATPALGNASGPGGLFGASGLERRVGSAITREERKFGRGNVHRRPKASVTYKEASEHTGAMVALFLPLDVASTVGAAAAALFGARAEKACELHITLGYLGKLGQDNLEAILPMAVRGIQRYVQMWLETVGMPIDVILHGYGAFPEAIDEGMVPIYRKVESPLLMMWVDGLHQVLDFVGVTAHRQHGAYTPHATVAYTYPEIVALLPQVAATATPVQFSSVTLALGDVQIDLPLTAQTYKALPTDTVPGRVGKPAGAPAAAAMGNSTGGHKQIAPGVYQIRGNLCQVHGKFGPCDSASSEGFGVKPKKAKGGKGAGKHKPTDEERKAKRKQDAEVRKQEVEAQRVQNRTESLAKLSTRPNDQAMAVLDTLRQGGQPDGAMLQSMESTGLITKHSDGSYTLSSQGHGLLDALDRGDAGKAAEAIANGKDQIASAADRATARNQVKTDRDAAKQQRLVDRDVRRAETQKRRAEADKRREQRTSERYTQSQTRLRRETRSQPRNVSEEA